VSTIYLALAVSANTASGGAARVIATENEPSKATIARQNWQEAGEEVASVIELREGDLRETLKLDLPAVDMLLLDSECARP
jgi:predicted O-methyltransferase YrrM